MSSKSIFFCDCCGAQLDCRSRFYLRLSFDLEAESGQDYDVFKSLDLCPKHSEEYRDLAKHLSQEVCAWLSEFSGGNGNE